MISQVPFPSVTVCNLNRVDCRRYERFVSATNCTGASADVAACESDNLARYGTKDVMGMTEDFREVVHCDQEAPASGNATGSDSDVEVTSWARKALFEL